MTLFGLDMNSSRARAVCGLAGSPRPVLLDGKERDLPLCVSLEKRRPQVGRPGVELCRRLPHLVCRDFLAYLGESRQWKAGRHRLDAARAVGLVLDRLRSPCSGIGGLGLALPAYISHDQATAFSALLAKARLPLAVSVSTPLAAAQAAYVHQPWCGLGLLLDADEHALTWSALACDEPASAPQVRVLGTQTFPKLSVRVWKERLLDGIADRCIRQSRRDPRENAEAEQSLFDQLDDALETCGNGQTSKLTVRVAHWVQNLDMPADDLVAFCLPLLRRSMDGLHALLETVQADGPPAVVLVAPEAARLPGLVAALEQQTGEPTAVTLLAADSVARAAHDLGARWQQGALPVEHRDVVLPLQRRSVSAVIRSDRPKSSLNQTKLPPRRSKVLPAEDDFSVTIDE